MKKNRKSATIFITKLGAAERQLNAAIRMTLTNEDELAVHSVAAAAYQILRNIKYKRGRSDAYDLFLRGLFAIAEDLAVGKIDSIPSSIIKSAPDLGRSIETIRDDLVADKIKSFENILPIDVPEKGPFWANFNRPANFLKHADKDPDDSLELSKVNNEELLMRATAAFFEITNRITPEIEAYYMFCVGDQDDSCLPDEMRLEFAGLSVEQKKKVCLKWIEVRRSSASPTQQA